MSSAVLSIGKVTDVGKVRSRNEDSMGVRRSETDEGVSLFVVADGMGGHSAGNVASQMAVERILEWFFANPGLDVAERLRRSVEDANRRIHEKAQSRPELFRMGTTVVSGAVVDNCAYVANVGDSRAYLVRGDEIRQVTRDHSWVALQVEMGELTPEEALTSQNRSVLLRCLGEKPDVLVDIFRVPLLSGDVLVMCSDGLHGQVLGPEIRDHVRTRAAQQACDELLALANERGGPDNITVQAIRVESCSAWPEGTSMDVTFIEAPEPGPGGAETGLESQGEHGGEGAAVGAAAPAYVPPLPPPLEPSDPTPPLPLGPMVVAFLFGMLLTFVGVRVFHLGGGGQGLAVPPAEAASPSANLINPHGPAASPSPSVLPGAVGMPARSAVPSPSTGSGSPMSGGTGSALPGASSSTGPAGSEGKSPSPEPTTVKSE